MCRKAIRNRLTYCMDKSDSNSGKQNNGDVRILHAREEKPHLIDDKVLKETKRNVHGPDMPQLKVQR